MKSMADWVGELAGKSFTGTTDVLNEFDIPQEHRTTGAISMANTLLSALRMIKRAEGER